MPGRPEAFCAGCGHGRVHHAFYPGGTSKCFRGGHSNTPKNDEHCTCTNFVPREVTDTNDVSFVSEAQQAPPRQDSLLGVVNDDYS